MSKKVKEDCNMMALVRFTDGVFHISKATNVNVTKEGSYAVRYTDRRKYAANLLILSADLNLLEYIKEHLEGDIPRIQMKNLVYMGTHLTGSQILEKKHLNDNKTLWIHETLLPSSDKEVDSYVIEIRENSTNIDADGYFSEVHLSGSGYTEVIKTNYNENPESKLPLPQRKDMTSSAEDSPPSTVGSKIQLDENEVPEININKTDETDVLQSIQDTAPAVLRVRSTTQLQENEVPEINENETDDTDVLQSIQDTAPAVLRVGSTTQLEENEVPEINENETDDTDVLQSIQDTAPAVLRVRSTTQLRENEVPEINENETDDTDVLQSIQDSATVAAGDSPPLKVESTIHLDKNEMNKNETNEIDVPKMNEYETDEVDSPRPIQGMSSTVGLKGELKEHVVREKSIEYSKSTTASVMSKPKIIAIEEVKFDLIRAPHLVDTSHSVASLLSLGDERGQDSFMLNNLPDYIFDNMILEDMNSSHNDLTNDLRLPESFDSLNPPPSSTVLESTSLQNTLTTNTEDSSYIGNDNKDKYYDPNGESYSIKTETLTCLPDTDAALTESVDEESQNTKPFSFHRPDKLISAPDDAAMRVSDSSTPSHKKKNFCFFCHKMQTKIARHLELVHADEEDVKKFIDLPKGCRERLDIIAILRKNGNHVYNTDKRFNEGTLITCRRPNERMRKAARDFTACGNCKGQYAKSVIRHHFRKCTKLSGKADRIVMVKGRAVMARIHENVSEDVLWKIFAYLREDEVVRAIRYDELLVLFANKQGEGYGTTQHLYQMIRARLRLLGRFLLAIRKVNSTVTDFASIYKPRCYDSCILAVKDVAAFQKETRRFKHPAVASHIGTLLKHVGELLRSKCIKAEEEKRQKQVEDFLKLLKEDYGTSINKAVAETQLQNDRRKKVKLPSAQDIAKLQDYLKTIRGKYFKILQVKFDYKAWQNLAEVTLVSLQIFNRRRAGEIERLYIDDFKSYEGIDAFADRDVYNSLSKEGQRLAKNYVRFMIRGKRGRGVPVLVPSHLLQCMDAIQKFRQDAKVPANNPYFFGLPSNDPDRHKYLRACNLLRQYAMACGAQVPDSLRGIKLRKHIATHCINLNLSETQVNDLANFMGHHEKIHKDIYRQPIVERDITKVSKLLEFAQGRNGPQEEESRGSDSDEEMTGHHRHQNDIEPPQDNRNSQCNENSKRICDSDDIKIHNATKKRKIVDPTGEGTQKKQCRESENLPITRRSWTGTEKKAVLEAFSRYLEGKRLPSFSEIQDLISRKKCLRGRTAPQVKTWLHNERQKMSL